MIELLSRFFNKTDISWEEPEYMKCKKCGKVSNKKGNQAVRISGERITVCPNCGHEEVMEKKKSSK